MKVHNPHEDRSILACITPSHLEEDPTKPREGKWYEIPPGESLDVEDFVVASTLVEYGAKADASELAAARELWAERNRLENSRTASAAASEGKILARQQATVDVATGTLSGGELRGDALARAVAQANASGAGIKSSASADEKRSALAVWQHARGSSSPVEQTRGGEFQTDENGELVLDDEGQPIPLANAGEVDAANPPHEEQEPAEEVSANADDVDGADDGEALVEGQDDDDADVDGASS